MVNASFPSFALYAAGLVLGGTAAALPAGRSWLRGAGPIRGRTHGHRHLGPPHRTYLHGYAHRLAYAAPHLHTHTHAYPHTPTVTPTFTPSAQVEGVYGDLAAHHHGSYRLRRRGDRVEADLVSTRSPVQHAARQQPQVLFTLPPAFRPPFPVLRRVVGQPVLVDGSPDPASPDPRPFRLQLAPDGAVRYLDHPDVAELGYLAYSLHLTWGTTPAANDQAVLQILEANLGTIWQEGVRFEDGRVTALEQFKLNGPLPPELGQLSHLQVLNIRGVGNGGLSGPLPPELGQLQNLIRLDLTYNQLTTLPPELGQLQNLETLHLGLNWLTGPLPPELGQLQNLARLDLGDNQLTALPPELGQLQMLSYLRLNQNQLTALPPELGQLQSLTYLDLRGNPLTGCLPAGWRDLGITIQPAYHLPFCTD